MPSDHSSQRAVGAWNPEIRSTLPTEYLPLSSMFRPENVFTAIDTAHELADFTGLPIQQLICFRPERLVIHELLIRVSADIFVSDGSRYEDLGINFRQVVSTILAEHIEPHLAEILASFDQLRQDSDQLVGEILAEELFATSAPAPKSEKRFSLANWFGKKKPARPASASETPEQRHRRLLATWQQRGGSAETTFERAVYAALANVANAIIIRHNRIVGDASLLTSLTTGMVCNDFGSERLGDQIAPYVTEAIEQQGYRLLPAQAEPVVINVKGASASGKSTMRPLQKLHVEKLGLDWQDFALISPDIWRKYLLDYDALGNAYKYAGTLAGDEIPIVDRKLDRYIGRKAQAGGISHLLIDRFRFDSFAPGHDSEQGSNLLTRFGHTVYLLFMVTPPPATVERAWLRGQQVGRYKAVDDLLDHNVEAFNGIPRLLFTWALRHDKTVYYEFLDNSVARGETPRTIAFGHNGELYIADFKCMLDIVRYTRINIEATSPDEVYPDAEKMAAEANTAFLVDCARKLPRIHFVERTSGMVYARMESGRMQWVDRTLIEQALQDPEARAAIAAMAPGLPDHPDSCPAESAQPIPAEARRHILGAMDRPAAR